MADSIPEIRASGILFIADPHVAATPPGQRLPGYREQIMDKLAACLERARELDAVPYILGDLFNWPRENPNGLVVDLMALLRPYEPFVLVGNHDKYQARLTPDTTIAVLEEARVINLVAESGPVFILKAPDGSRTLVGGTPDGEPLPREFHKASHDVDHVVWTSHHNIAFPDFEEKQHRLREIPGIDWLVNGHIHRPQPTVKKGSTTWANPGNMVRLTFTRRSLERIPRAHLWTPGCEDLKPWTVPHKDFYEVFPNQEFPPEEHEKEGDSHFLQGLERLAWKRTEEGAGLKQFLNENLNPDQEETPLIWELYKEAVDGK